MTPAEARRAAYRFIASVVLVHGDDDSLASYLRLPAWVPGENHPERHPDVRLVAAEVDNLLSEMTESIPEEH